MGFKLRKLYVGLVSLAALLTIYLLYSGISGTARIDIHADTEFGDIVADFNADIGKIDEVGIGIVQFAEYITRNSKTKEIEQIFGFEKLIDQEGDQWRLQKPLLMS